MNNEIEAENFKADGTSTGKMTIEYKYDKVGNWTKQVFYVNGEKQKSTNRIIKYYK